MKIYEQSPSSRQRQRRFVADNIQCEDLPPGTLVCLRDVHGRYLSARQTNRNNHWELVSQQLSSPSPLPGDALFSVLRRGRQIGFQCLGAGGRFLSAIEHSEDIYSLAEVFGNRESWEITTSGHLTSCQFNSRVFNAKPQIVTALPTEQLARWEHEKEIQIKELLNRLEAQIKEAADNDRRSSDLIKDGHRTIANSQREIENLRNKLETTSRLALHWQEDAALSAKALATAEAELQSLQECQPINTPTNITNNNTHISNIDEILALKTEIVSMQQQHTQQIHDLQSKHKTEIHSLHAEIKTLQDESSQGAISFVELNALQHRLVSVQAEKARLESALRCIKDMMHHSSPSSIHNNNNNNSTSSTGVDISTSTTTATTSHHHHHDDISNTCQDAMTSNMPASMSVIQQQQQHPLLSGILLSTAAATHATMATTATTNNNNNTATTTTATDMIDHTVACDDDIDIEHHEYICDLAVGIPIEDVLLHEEDHYLQQQHQNLSASGSSFSLKAVYRPEVYDAFTANNTGNNNNTSNNGVVENGGSSSRSIVENDERMETTDRCTSAQSYHSCDDSHVQEITTQQQQDDYKNDDNVDGMVEDIDEITPENSVVHAVYAEENEADIKESGNDAIDKNTENNTNDGAVMKNYIPQARQGSISAPSSGIKSEKVETTMWAAGSLSLPGSRLTSPISNSTTMLTASNADDAPTMVHTSSIPEYALLQLWGTMEHESSYEEEEEEETGQQQQQGRDGCTYSLSHAVDALGKQSPTTAGHITQYMASKLSMRASAPVLNLKNSLAVDKSIALGGRGHGHGGDGYDDDDNRRILSGRSSYGMMMKRSTVQTNNNNMKKDGRGVMMSMINHYRRSTGQDTLSLYTKMRSSNDGGSDMNGGMMRRSSFLQRRPINDKDIYGGGF